jgi:SAM-dependent methyltransferase
VAEKRAARAQRTSLAPGSTFSTVLLEHAVTATAAGLPPAVRLLDVGCGDMPYRQAIDARTYIGLDRMHSFADRRPSIAADGQRLPIRASCCDAVLCTEVIEHVADERALAAELARVTEPGGRLVLTAPFVHGLHEQPHDYRRPTSVGLHTLLADHGFEVLAMYSLAGTGAVLADLVLRELDRVVHKIVRHLCPRRWRMPVRRATVGRLSSLLGHGWVRRSGGGRRWRIDPFVPLPRLTLGYAVHAVRNEATVPGPAHSRIRDSLSASR